jgi:hypothetical protein
MDRNGLCAEWVEGRPFAAWASVVLWVSWRDATLEGGASLPAIHMDLEAFFVDQ